MAAGALTATLAVAAHAMAGGGLPSGAAVTVLALVAATIAMLVVSIRDAADVKVLAVLLSVGQVLGHAVLGAGGHAHAATAAPWWLMIAAHVGAVVLGAALIAVGGYLGSAVSRVIRAVAPIASRPVAPLAQRFHAGADQPFRSVLLLHASMSYRGPPVSTV